MSKQAKKLVVGILAHVDAGKTTLAESIMYVSGGIRKLGRVDHGDAFLDSHELERARGITIFSKQAEVILQSGEQKRQITLLDTPGHVDFSAETERTLQVLDAAILVISGADGVQGHVETLWKLLKRYEIPVFLFVNKMDQPGTDKESLLQQLKEKLDDNCVDFTFAKLAGAPMPIPGMEEEEAELFAFSEEDRQQGYEAFCEGAAMCCEELMEEYLDTGVVEQESLQKAIAGRKLFPCYFGSALKMKGLGSFFAGMVEYSTLFSYPEEFSARVYKITRDNNNNRLTHLKVLGGALKVKQVIGEEKADQLRIYSGTGYQLTEVAEAGTICAVTGLSDTFCGQGLGVAAEGELPTLVPVLNYRIELPEGCDVHRMLKNLYLLEEEIPELHIVWREQSSEIHAQVMGEVQVEILKDIIAKRFDVAVEFGSGSIVYKETILEPVEGIGHFEPLRHYAEVHLLLEPGEPGSGMSFEADCSEDELDKNWQRLILTHLEEKKHVGVLTGSEITDMKITLIAGRAHLKHTEGGDFRQATYRAVRHGLKRAKSQLLEPVYEYVLEIPTECIGRAMNDIQRMYGTFQEPETMGEMSVLRGTAPVVTMNGYQSEVNAYARGRGRLTCRFQCYAPCHNEAEVIEAYGYDSEHDLENPTGSVFCAHGAGFVVGWQEVEAYAHVESGWQGASEADAVGRQEYTDTVAGGSYQDKFISQEEIEEIFERTYGNRAKDKNPWNRQVRRTISTPAKEVTYHPKKQEPLKEYLLVDGYNIIFAWEDLKELAKVNVESARGKLMDILSNYQGYVKNTLIVVFDAYKVKGNPGSVSKYHNIYVVYTKEAETADQYIEKTVHEIGRKYHVTVATSDALEQMIIWGQGATRLSAQGLREEIASCNQERQEEWKEQNTGQRYFPFEELLKKEE
ncbi:MAG: TetM/TetW/TetO/TetS family tetracycline resistance ribosomal protection protein [Lachnospiraceae bacterium]|nr:TetM/TetW/TetO/TetS family tetracycline resistance ribosomal protection protein [Lachnospiraceae bacterium]